MLYDLLLWHFLITGAACAVALVFSAWALINSFHRGREK